MGKPGGKRKAGFYKQSAKKARYGSKLDSGMRGILITCNKREREAVREAYNLLNEYADKLYGPEEGIKEENDDSSEEEEDIEAALKKEVDSLKKKKPAQRRFQQVETGTNNVIFVRTCLENPTELVHAIFSDCLASQQSKSRFILRMLPVLGTCSAYKDKIATAATELLEPFFSHGQPTTYSLQIKVRNNNGLSRTSLLPVLGYVMEELNPNARVEFSDPENIVNVDILKTVCCFSCLKDFSKFRKYNLQEIIEASRTVNKVKEKQDDGKDSATTKVKAEESDISDTKEKVTKDGENDTQTDKEGAANISDTKENHTEDREKDTENDSEEMSKESVESELEKKENEKGVENTELVKENTTVENVDIALQEKSDCEKTEIHEHPNDVT